jgi:hypothetical protein
MIARIGFHPALIVVRPLAQRLLADLGNADDVAEEVHHQLRPRQRGQIAVNDNPVKAANERRRRIIMNENGGGGRSLFQSRLGRSCRAGNLCGGLTPISSPIRAA